MSLRQSENTVLPESVLVQGYGQMGGYYLNNLSQLGMNMEGVTVHEIDPEKRKKAEMDHPGIRTVSDLDRIDQIPQVGLVLTNSPAHLGNIRDQIRLGLGNIFVEKPLVLAGETDELAELGQQADIVTAYLINHSPAVREMTGYIDAGDAKVVAASSQWGKNRRGNNRPTAGNLADETTHPINTIDYLVRRNQDVVRQSVDATLYYDQFVDEAVQAQAHARDKSFPLQPTSAVSMRLNSIIDRRDHNVVSAQINTSFVRDDQIRQISVRLGGDPDYDGEYVLRFDQRNGDSTIDTLHQIIAGRECLLFGGPAGDKLGVQLSSYLRSVCDPTYRDDALIGIEDAIRMVRIEEAALHSHQTGRLVSVRS